MKRNDELRRTKEAESQQQKAAPGSSFARIFKKASQLVSRKPQAKHEHASGSMVATDPRPFFSTSREDALMERRLEAVFVSFALYNKWDGDALVTAQKCHGMSGLRFLSLCRASGLLEMSQLTVGVVKQVFDANFEKVTPAAPLQVEHPYLSGIHCQQALTRLTAVPCRLTSSAACPSPTSYAHWITCRGRPVCSRALSTAQWRLSTRRTAYTCTCEQPQRGSHRPVKYWSVWSIRPGNRCGGHAPQVILVLVFGHMCPLLYRCWPPGRPTAWRMRGMPIRESISRHGRPILSLSRAATPMVMCKACLLQALRNGGGTTVFAMK